MFAPAGVILSGFFIGKYIDINDNSNNDDHDK